MLKVIPFEYEIRNKPSAAFVAITARSAIYRDYHEKPLSEEIRNAAYPFVLMLMRWDGRIGFIGGYVENGEDCKTRVLTELREEANMTLSRESLIPLIAHETDRLVVRLYHAPLGVLDPKRLQEILHRAAGAEHSLTEGGVFWAHLADYSGGKGWKILRGSNHLAYAVGEELDLVRAQLFT